MDYLIKISPTATLQLNQIVKYISEILLVPETAKKWLDVIEKAILSLDTLPNSCNTSVRFVRATFCCGYIRLRCAAAVNCGVTA